MRLWYPPKSLNDSDPLTGLKARDRLWDMGTKARGRTWTDLHQGVCDRIAQAGVKLQPGLPEEFRPGELGFYHRDPRFPLHKSKGVIRVRREHQNIVDDFKAETLTLAHELGHAMSEVAGTRPHHSVRDRYDGCRGDLSHEEAESLYEEEVRAWRHALDLLQELGCDDMGYAEQTRDDSLGAHRDRLELVLLADGSVQTAPDEKPQ